MTRAAVSCEADRQLPEGHHASSRSCCCHLCSAVHVTCGRATAAAGTRSRMAARLGCGPALRATCWLDRHQRLGPEPQPLRDPALHREYNGHRDTRHMGHDPGAARSNSDSVPCPLHRSEFCARRAHVFNWPALPTLGRARGTAGDRPMRAWRAPSAWLRRPRGALPWSHDTAAHRPGSPRRGFGLRPLAAGEGVHERRARAP